MSNGDTKRASQLNEDQKNVKTLRNVQKAQEIAKKADEAAKKVANRRKG